MTSFGEWRLVRRLPSRRRALYEAIRIDAPWTRAALVVERGEQGRRELRAMADAARRLSHPGIVGLVEDASGAATPIVALAWCEGRRLDAAIDALSGDQRLDIAIHIADLVAHAHARDVVIRDLKPSNLLVPRGAGRAVLVDLDLARVGRPEPGRPAGTWCWTAPEQAVLDASEIDARADIYALGTTLYFVFAGEPLFSAGPPAIIEQLAGARVVERTDRLPAAIAPIVRACLARDRRERITADAVAAHLRRLCGAAAAGETPRAPSADTARCATGDVAAATLAGLAAALDDGHGLAAAEAHLQIHDPAGAAALAGELLAQDADDPRALACLARAQVELGARGDAVVALDRLDELPAADALDGPRRARVIEAELLALRPRRALAWAHRAPAPERDSALERVVALAREWLRELDRLDDDARLAWEAMAPRAMAAEAVRRSLGAALVLLGRRDDDDAVAAMRELLAALAEDRVALDVPLGDLHERGPEAERLCAALLLHLEGLDDAARALPQGDAIDAARLALVTGRPDEARAGLERAQPSSALAVHVRALALFGLGQRDAAIDLLSSAHGADPTPETMRWLSHALLRAGRAPEAVALLETAPRRGSRTAWSADSAGSAWTGGSTWSAWPAWPAWPAWIDRMRIAALVEAGRSGDAIAACDAAGTADAVATLARAVEAELDRRGPDAGGRWQDVPRARALVRTGLAAGRFDLVRAVHAAAGTLETLDLLIATCRARGTPGSADEALAACRAAHDAHPCGDHALRLIDALAAAGARDAAAQVLATWLHQAPDHAGLWCAAAQALLAERDWDQAAAAAARALALEPRNRDAAACAMIASLERGEPARTIALAREAVAAWPRGDLAWDILLEAEQALGGRDPAAAISRIRAALRACPGSPRLHRRLATALAAAGQIDEALAAQRDAVAAEPHDRTLWADRARLLLAAGRAAEALHVAHALQRLAGDVPEVGAIRLWAWLALGEPALAIEAGTAVVAADAAGPALWEGLALAWLATGALADARNALAMMQRTDGRADRGAGLALSVALAGDVDGDLVRALADDAVALDPRDPDLAFLAAIARLARGDAATAARALDALLGDAPRWIPALHTAIALACIGPEGASALDRALQGQLAAAPHALGWAGAIYLIARGRAADAAALARRAGALAGDTHALALVEAEAALRAGDEAALRALGARLSPGDRANRDDLAGQLARRLGGAARVSVLDVGDA